MTEKEIVYIDLDGPCAEYDKMKLKKNHKEKGFFLSLFLTKHCKISIKLISQKYDIYFASTAPWSNINSWSEKRQWVQKKFGKIAFKKLILLHNKGLLRGKFIIDDRKVNGVENFKGKHIQFGSKEFPDWISILNFLGIKHELQTTKRSFKNQKKIQNVKSKTQRS